MTSLLSSSIVNIQGSQETLVSDEQFQFRFTNDNPVNTNILGPDRNVLYRVNTTFVNGTITTVERTNGGSIAALHWSDVLADKIAVGTEKPVRMSKILHTGPFLSQTVSFKDETGRKYQWKGYEAKGTLRLYAVDESDNPLIAAFMKSRPNEATGQRTPAYLWINPRGQEILDMVIWTCCFLEKNRRPSDNGYGSFSRYGA